jgi:hypothetical protein
MANWFSGNGFAWVVNVERCSISARAVIEVSAIAVTFAATRPDSISTAVPTIGIRTVKKHGKITVTGSGSIGNAGRKRA